MSLNVQGFNHLNHIIMKKSILNLGKALSKSQQQQLLGGSGRYKNPCPCTSSFETHGGGECSYPSTGSTPWGDPFPGSRCYGEIKSDGRCCVN